MNTLIHREKLKWNGVRKESYMHMSSRHLVAFIACALMIAPLVIASQAPSAGVLGPGVFYSSGSGWLKLLEAPSPTLSTENFAEFLVDPINDINVRYAYAGSQAVVQISDRRPVFHANLGLSPDRDLRSVQIVHLKKKNGYRQSILRWYSGNMQVAMKRAVPVTIGQGADGVFTVTPSNDLEPGEYLLSFGRMAMQYDFTVR